MNKLFQIINNNIKPFLISTTIVGSSLLSYFLYITSRNRIQYQKLLQNDELYKDTSRDSNQFYGLSWGFQADQIISDKVDAGDMFLIKYECQECMNLRDIFQCHWIQLLNHEQDYDSLGFSYRDKTGLYIIANQFGQTKVLTYSEFLSQPFLKELSLRKLVVKNSTKEDNKKIYRNVSQYFNKIKEKIIDESPEQMAFNYLKNMNALKEEIVKEDLQPYIVDYDNTNPFFLNNRFNFDNKIVIRTNTNKELNI